MLETLSAFHEAILAAASELECLARAPEPDCPRLAHVRFTIAKSSNARSRLLESTIYPTLLNGLSGSDAAKVQRLRDERLQGLRQTAEHIAEWGTQRIAGEWPQFQREASKRLSGLRSSVSAEQAILLPMIEKLRAIQQGSERLGPLNSVPPAPRPSSSHPQTSRTYC